jgi:hypothetical protein
MALFPGSYERVVNYTLEDLISEARENLVEVSFATMVEVESHNLLAQYMASMITQSQYK